MNRVTTDPPTLHKTLIAPLRASMYDFTEAGVREALAGVVDPEAVVHLCHPFGDVCGPQALYDAAYAGLLNAVPDLERRDDIVLAGATPEGAHWLGCGGYYTGRFARPWMDIPPTGHLFHMRFHEFFRFEDGKVAEVQLLWDIPEVMMQACAWPMAPGLGREWHVPGPATQDGLVPGPHDRAHSEATRQIIIEMLAHMSRHPAQGGPEVMEMPRFWHEHMSWYGPAGIGTARGIKAFRDWHQIPFLRAMPDRGQYPEATTHHFFADANYAAVTGWPDMMQTVTGGGWMGIVPSGRRITMRSLDFWRVENGRIRENWVLIDLLHVYDQLGVDVLGRMREFNKARVGFDPESGRARA